jgi:hypothetical protein
MAIAIKHQFVSAKSDGADSTIVQPSDWNDTHDLEQATDRMLGRVTAGTGATEELTAAQVRTFLGSVDVTAITDVASSATTDLGAAATDVIRITGTTGITSFGTDANQLKFVYFAAALTITHNGTSLILPGSANLSVKADDAMIVASDASGNWRTISYQAITDYIDKDYVDTAAPNAWVRKTANYTAVAGDRIIADTVATAAFIITLPSSPSGGDEVTIIPGSSYNTNNLTINRNFETIMGLTAALVLDTTTAVTLVYDGTDSDWRVF